MGVLSLLLTLFFFNVNDCTKCNGQILAATERGIERLSRQDVAEFFCVIDNSCIDNVEFMEYVDELMYTVINAQPEFSILALNSLDSDNLNFILERLADPHESADLTSAHSKISSVPGHDKIKKQVLSAIQTAIDNTKIK